MSSSQPIIIATRGSALALAQANQVLARCRAAWPGRAFELTIIKTTGDKLQSASLTNPDGQLPKGLFTKELEDALLSGKADLAVHSLKDLPTELPDGLTVAATPLREDVRDVLVCRAVETHWADAGSLMELSPGARVGTSSTRRKMQLLTLRPDLAIGEIRGNVPTRLRKVAEAGPFQATVLAMAGLSRLQMIVQSDGTLKGNEVPEGLRARILSLEEMVPCVGQGAIAIEIRAGDQRLGNLLVPLNDPKTFTAITAERAFLQAMGGGCLSPVAAHATIQGGTLSIQAVSFRDGTKKVGSITGQIAEAASLGAGLASQLR